MTARSPRRRRGHTRLFLYGSLMRGLHNHHLLDGARFIAEDRTRAAFTLCDFGSFPAMVAGGTTSVAGEVWEVNADTLARLDALEGHPRWYRRTPIVLASRRKAETYLMPADKIGGRPSVDSGDWRRHRAEADALRMRALGSPSPALAHTMRYLEDDVAPILERLKSG
jgi:gamma-glutamylcyclotransferase (GGCT)/AIG2-like uncharacterized protein YtfP